MLEILSDFLLFLQYYLTKKSKLISNFCSKITDLKKSQKTFKKVLTRGR